MQLYIKSYDHRKVNEWRWANFLPNKEVCLHFFNNFNCYKKIIHTHNICKENTQIILANKQATVNPNPNHRKKKIRPLEKKFLSENSGEIGAQVDIKFHRGCK